MAEFIFKDRIKKLGLEDEFYCESRAVSNEEDGNDLYYLAKDCLDKYHIPYTRHHARKISQKDYDEFDEIYVMDNSNMHYIHYLLKDNENKIKMLLDSEIPDPWYYGNFDGTYEAINKGIDKILEA